MIVWLPKLNKYCTHKKKKKSLFSAVLRYLLSQTHLDNQWIGSVIFQVKIFWKCPLCHTLANNTLLQSDLTGWSASLTQYKIPILHCISLVFHYFMVFLMMNNISMGLSNVTEMVCFFGIACWCLADVWMRPWQSPYVSAHVCPQRKRQLGCKGRICCLPLSHSPCMEGCQG